MGEKMDYKTIKHKDFLKLFLFVFKNGCFVILSNFLFILFKCTLIGVIWTNLMDLFFKCIVYF